MAKSSKSEKSEAEPRKAGQPTKYLPEHCETIIELGKKGFSVIKMARHFGVDRDTLSEWAKEHQGFSDALTQAKQESQIFWEDKYDPFIIEESGKDIVTERINSAVWLARMKSQFPESYIEGYIPPTERRAKAKLDLELLAQRKEIEAAEALQRQVKAEDDARIRALDIEIKKKLVAGEIVQDQSAAEAFVNFAKYMNTAAEKLHESNRQKQDGEEDE